MNILFCADEFSHESQPNTGGIGAYYSDLCRMLSSSKHNVYYIGLSTKPYEGVENGVSIKIIKPFLFNDMTRKIISSAPLLFLPISVMIDFLFKIKYILYIKSFVVNNNIDVIEVPDYKGISSYFKLFGIKVPIVIRTHGSNTSLHKINVQKKSYLSCLNEWLASKRQDGVIYISEASRDEYEKNFGINNSSTIIYNAVDISCEKKIKTKDVKILKVCNFGTISNAKGLDIILKLSSKFLGQVEFYLIGKESADLRTVDLKAYPNVFYLGVFPRDKMLENIAAFDVSIFPSKFENCPLSWVESLLSGVPIIVSDIPVANEIVTQNINGFICSDFSDYNNAIEFLLNADNFNKINNYDLNMIEDKFSRIRLINNSVAFYSKLLIK
ncbi:TPA: glycosyltransferase family 4 protein [Photobacterium damselae]